MNAVAEARRKENAVAERLRSYGIKAERNERVFFLPDKTNYTPDLYLPDLNIYVEVIGSRQAFESNKHKYDQMVKSGAVNFMLLNHDFGSLYPEKFNSTMSRPKCIVGGCKVFACNESIKADKLYCTAHWHRLTFYGVVEQNVGEWWALRKTIRCHWDGCQESIRHGAYCKTHNQTARHTDTFKSFCKPRVKANVKCSYPPCDRKALVKGFCLAHYTQHHQGKSLTPIGRKRSAGLTFSTYKPQQKQVAA